jgi:hypothetical protein
MADASSWLCAVARYTMTTAECGICGTLTVPSWAPHEWRVDGDTSFRVGRAALVRPAGTPVEEGRPIAGCVCARTWRSHQE